MQLGGKMIRADATNKYKNSIINSAENHLELELSEL